MVTATNKDLSTGDAVTIYNIANRGRMLPEESDMYHLTYHSISNG